MEKKNTQLSQKVGLNLGGLADIIPTGLLQGIPKIIAPVTLITALLFYFGWKRTEALYYGLGIDQSLLDFDTTDYIIRSISVSFDLLRKSLLVCLAVFVFVLVIHAFLHWGVETQRRWVLIVLLVFSFLLGVTFVLASVYQITELFYKKNISILWYPVTFAIGIGFCSYGLYLIKLITIYNRERKAEINDYYPHLITPEDGVKPGDGDKAVGGDRSGDVEAFYKIFQGLFFGLFILGLFWFAANYAEQIGSQKARWILYNVSTYPTVVVYSQNRLGLSGSGIEEVQIGSEKDTYLWRYTGLKFFVLAGGRFFLLPANSSELTPVTIILPDNETIRIEVSPK